MTVPSSGFASVHIPHISLIFIGKKVEIKSCNSRYQIFLYIIIQSIIISSDKEIVVSIHNKEVRVMEILFFILFFIIFGKLINFAFRASWSLMKAIFFIMFLPLILVGMVLGGMVYIALPILIVIGFASLFKAA